MTDLSKLSDKELLNLKKKTELDISKYHNFQLVRKIQLNSAYGALGNAHFRFYNTDLAEAITLSGQLSIQWIGNRLNELLNTVSHTKNEDYIIASDTDSVYLKIENIVNHYAAHKTLSEKIDYVNSASENIILPYIEKQFDSLANMMNAYENKIIMAREVIADKGVWTAKKRYMLNVWDSEGVRYTQAKQKIMGIETSRSSTPEIVRKELKNAISIILNKNEEDIIHFVENFKSKFMKLTVEEISFPRSVNGIDKYKDSSQIYKLKTPIQVKAALLYNHYIKEMKLGMKYNKILEGEKIKFVYLKKPNPLSGTQGEDCVIGFPNKIPKEFDLDKFIDREKQFEKSFLDPLVKILDIIGWKAEKTNTLESLFG
jgi:DNA polymerase elongation subunit (family B)